MIHKTIILLVAVISISGCATLSMSSGEMQIAVKQLVDQVQTAIDNIKSQTAGSKLPPLQSAELTLSSKAEKVENGKVSLFLTAKAGSTQTDSNSITLVLIPNPNPIASLVPGPGQDIANAVVAAVAALQDMQGLTLKSLTVTAALEIVKNAGGGFKIELLGVSTEGGAEKIVTSGHSLKLIFEIPEQ
uniref:Lipoprotein n=1 Tax=Candidatus Kentrum sp. TC TaxID=2126339 RepID=A0A450Z472_9GAMM|nr:MAG: hypothetical protein BECKTC1821E_GA0114239_111911 [Candidatus Kentron sp. TC]